MTSFNNQGFLGPDEREANKRLGDPIDPEDIDTTIMNRVLVDYAVEQHQWLIYSALTQRVSRSEFRKTLTNNSMDEQMHLIKFGMLLSPSTKEMSSYRQDGECFLAKQDILRLKSAAVHTLAEFAQSEEDIGIKNIFDNILLDHLTHLKTFSDKFCSSLSVETVLGGGIEIPNGSVIDDRVLLTGSLIGGNYNHFEVDPMTKMRVFTSISIEVDIQNRLQGYLKMPLDRDKRELIADILRLGSWHTSILNSLIDPTEPHLEIAITGELTEVYNHRRSMDLAVGHSVEEIFRLAYSEDLEHLRVLVDIADELGIIGIIERIPADIAGPEPALSTDMYIEQLLNEGDGNLLSRKSRKGPKAA